MTSLNRRALEVQELDESSRLPVLATGTARGVALGQISLTIHGECANASKFDSSERSRHVGHEVGREARFGERDDEVG